MCGIAGVASLDHEDLLPLPGMTSALRHRGPDGEGYLFASTSQCRTWAFGGEDTPPGVGLDRLPASVPSGADLALGHRRLAIIDLSPAGHGPMSSQDGRLWITYNGEVFNYRELREELRGRGHVFRSASDTEVLLAAYAEWGPSALHRFNGMWAFALYDAPRKLLFCARDRFGVKPFHYYAKEGFFAFASEIKGLLAHPAVPRRPHVPTLSGFLAGGLLDEDGQTFFEGIGSLPGGHSLTVDLASRKPRVERWYELPEAEPRPGDAAELRGLLEDAVRLRLRSDVDVGTCLSGGLDSSSIVVLTARLRGNGDGQHRSFSVVYPDRGLDESAHVDAVVAATGVLSTRTTPTSRELLDDLPALARAQDEPFPSAALYSQWRVMSLAHEAGVKVLLDGQGGDEVLGGYHYHYGPYLAEVASRVGTGAAVAQARKASAVTGRPLAFFLGLLAYHRLPLPEALRHWTVERAATHGRVPAALLDGAALDGSARSQRHRPRPTLAAERRAGLLVTSLPALLRYEDRNSMAFGVEARTPFLDYRLVERAMTLPAGQLIRDGWTKAPLREAMQGLVPEGILRRGDKLGFATPETRWLREIAPEVREWLGPGAHVAAVLRPGRLADWMAVPDEVLARRSGLWRLLSAELWLREVGRR